MLAAKLREDFAGLSQPLDAAPNIPYAFGRLPKNPMERLQKILASAGIGSRRACEELILQGRVEVDRKVVMTLGVKADPVKQSIHVDGSAIKIQRREYYLLNKPPGVISTNSDPSRRMRVVDLVKSKQRIFTVGRLDKSSEGLMIITNDGELAQKLTHPKFGCQKNYLVTVAGIPPAKELLKLKEGIHLSDGFFRIQDFRIRKKYKTSSEIEIILKEGRNREIRRLLAKIGHKVLKLKRIAIGPIRLGELPLGAHRRMEAKELKKLRESVENTSASGAKQRGKKKRTHARHSTAGSPAKKKKVNTEKTKNKKKPPKKIVGARGLSSVFKIQICTGFIYKNESEKKVDKG